LTLPNFCSYDAEGNLYVSNSSTEDISKVLGEITTPSPKGALVRIRPDGRGDVVATGLYLANGTAIDPKEDAVYVLQSTRNDCLRIQIKKDGTFGKPEVYSKDFPALPDGMAIVQISERDWELGKNYPAEIAINANVRETLRALNAVLRSRMTAAQKSRKLMRKKRTKPSTLRQIRPCNAPILSCESLCRFSFIKCSTSFRLVSRVKRVHVFSTK
jgi:hypothetical protein